MTSWRPFWISHFSSNLCKKKLFLQEILMGYWVFHWILMKIYKMNKNINSLDYFYSFIQKKDRNVCKIPES